MNTIMQGYLDKFVDDFELDATDASKNFEKFCAYSVLKNEVPEIDDNDLEEIIIGDNKGIDAICFSINGSPITNIKEINDFRKTKKNFDATVYFIQAKTKDSFEDSEIGNFCDTVIDFLSEKPTYPLTPKAKEYHGMYIEILKSLAYLKIFNCKLFYCCTGTWSAQTTCATTMKKKKGSLSNSGFFKGHRGDMVDVIPVDNEKLRRLADKANQPLNAEFKFSSKMELKEIANVREAYLGVLPFGEFKKIIIDQETGKLKPLFYDNVRDFLGIGSKVNEKINKTLADREFSLFQLLNNGITIIAEENKGRSDTFILVNSQVVNGCQTSNVLFANKDATGIDDLHLPVKLIITDNPDIRDKIIVSSNNQTAIKEEQLLALTSFQKNLEALYRHMPDGLRYERRVSQYSGELNIKKNAIVNIREQIKSFVSMFLDEPHVVSGYFGKVYKDRQNDIFNKNHALESYYISGFVQYLFKKLVSAKKISRKYNKARYHIFMLFRKITEPSKGVDLNNTKMTKKYCDKVLNILRNPRSSLNKFMKAIDIIDKSGINIDDQKGIYKKATTTVILNEYNKNSSTKGKLKKK